MNIIEALQALKDGKKIRMGAWKNGEYFMACQDGMIVNHKGKIQEMTACNILTNKWELYTEPLKLAEDEIKALKLARECGFEWIEKTDYGAIIWVNDDEPEFLVTYIPALYVLDHPSWITEEPRSIDSLLEGTI